MHYKVLFLAMSCNDPFFVESRKVVQDTWAKYLIMEEYPEYGFYSYTASETGEEYIKDNTIYLNCGDGIHDTFDKTLRCFQFLKEQGITYDYVVRTNTSVYVNIFQVSRLVNYWSWSNIDIEGYTINIDYSSFYDDGKYPVIAGFFFIMSSNFIDKLISYSKLLILDKTKTDYGYDDFEISKLIRIMTMNREILNINILNPFGQVKYKTISKNRILRDEKKTQELYNVYTNADIVNMSAVVQYRIKNLDTKYRYQELENAYELDEANIYRINK